jgi:NADH-quinone oxidoreductase subunit J
MLLNLDDDKPLVRLRFLFPVGAVMGIALLAQTFFIFYAVTKTPSAAPSLNDSVGLTKNIGEAMYTQYLLPVEIVGILLLMGIVGAVVLARRNETPRLEVVKGSEQLKTKSE